MNNNNDIHFESYRQGVEFGIKLAFQSIRKKREIEKKRDRLNNHLKYFFLWWKLDFEITASNVINGIKSFFIDGYNQYKETKEKIKAQNAAIKARRKKIEAFEKRHEQARKNVQDMKNKYLLMTADELNAQIVRFILQTTHQYAVLQRPIISNKGDFILNEDFYIELRTYIYGMFETTFGQLRPEFDILYYNDYITHAFNLNYDIARSDQIPQMIKNVLKNVKFIEESE